MTDPAAAEMTALDAVTSKLEATALIAKGLELINNPLLFTSIGLVLVAFLFRMGSNITRNALGEEAEHTGKALAVLVGTCLALVLYRHVLDLGVRLSEGVLGMFELTDMRSMAVILDDLLDKHFEGLGFTDFIDPGSLFMGLALIAYGITAILLLLLIAIYGVALAYSFILLIIMGYLVIPMSLASRNFDMTSGWVKMMLTVLLWPILERIVFISSSWIMLDVAQAKELSLVDGPDAAAAACLAFTILNCLMCAGVCYAPRMAAALCSNSGDLSPSLEPFGKAAFGATMAVKMSSLMAYGMVRRIGGNLAHNTFKGFNDRFSPQGQGAGRTGSKANFNGNKFDGYTHADQKDFKWFQGEGIEGVMRKQQFHKSLGMSREDLANYGKGNKMVSRMGPPSASGTSETQANNTDRTSQAHPSKSASSETSTGEKRFVRCPYTGAKTFLEGTPPDTQKPATLESNVVESSSTEKRDAKGLSSVDKVNIAKEAMRSQEIESLSTVMEKSNPSSISQEGPVGNSQASAKPQQKSPEEIKKAKDRKNAIIRQNKHRDQSFNWSPKTEGPKK